jgi:hypothetical protein
MKHIIGRVIMIVGSRYITIGDRVKIWYGNNIENLNIIRNLDGKITHLYKYIYIN